MYSFSWVMILHIRSLVFHSLGSTLPIILLHYFHLSCWLADFFFFGVTSPSDICVIDIFQCMTYPFLSLILSSHKMQFLILLSSKYILLSFIVIIFLAKKIIASLNITKLFSYVFFWKVYGSNFHIYMYDSSQIHISIKWVKRQGLSFFQYSYPAFSKLFLKYFLSFVHWIFLEQKNIKLLVKILGLKAGRHTNNAFIL